jgi:4-amino-4-deoxy-L-arabinose transferase-like glycosyltransferase
VSAPNGTPASPEKPEGPTQAELRWMGLALFTVAFLSAVLTASDYGIASDVGNYFYSSLRQFAWVRKLGEALLAWEPSSVLDRDVVFNHWDWYGGRIPHPPLSRELGGVSYVLFRRLLDPLTAYRMAVMAAYGGLAAATAVFTAWAARSRTAGFAAGAALLTIPALFAHAHLAHTDLFLTAFWFGCAAVLHVYVRTGKAGWLVAAGLLFGAAAATKFTGLLLLPMAGVWLLARRRPLPAALIVLVLLGALVFLAVNPVLWVDPAQGLRDYFATGLLRSRDMSSRISTEYFGRIYDFRPPWHYPFVWTAIVVPLPLLAAAGLGATSRRDGGLRLLILANLAVLYGALMLPAAPMHDGIRLFLPVLPFLCVLGGLGVSRLLEILQARLQASALRPREWLIAVVFVAVFAIPALRVIQYHPYQLSYFNALVGGVRGAYRQGLEVTNLKEVLSRETLSDLRAAIPDGSVIDPGFFMEEVCFYQAIGWAPAGWVAETRLERQDLEEGTALACEGPQSFIYVPLDRPAADPDFVFVLNRRAQWRALEWALYDFGDRPLYEVTVQGVPLMRVYRVR